MTMSESMLAGQPWTRCHRLHACLCVHLPSPTRTRLYLALPATMLCLLTLQPFAGHPID